MSNEVETVTFVPVTMEEALTVREVHENYGARPGKCAHWRRSGQTRTWKTRPGEFRMPIMYGLRTHAHMTDLTADNFHTAKTCPFGNA